MKFCFNKVALGGTFDTLHTGHVKLLATAALVGENLLIGLTNDDFASSYKKYEVKPYIIRLINLKLLMNLIAPDKKIEYIELKDPYGPSVEDPAIEALVVSRETLPRGFEINEERTKRGLRPVEIIVISTVKDGYGNIMSSTFVRKLLDESRKP